MIVQMLICLIDIDSAGSQGKKKTPKRNTKKKPIAVNKSKENVLSVVTFNRVSLRYFLLYFMFFFVAI